MTEEKKKLVDIFEGCDLFFKEALDEAMDNQHTHLSQESALYLLRLLIGATRNDNPKEGNKTMAEKYNKALMSLGDNSESGFRSVGDESLVISGIWWRSLLRKIVDVDYYINIGRQSYKQASRENNSELADVFGELAEKFKKSANVLTEATRCISEANLSDRDILRMYEVWLRTHNVFLAKKLKLLGINVVPGTVARQ